MSKPDLRAWRVGKTCSDPWLQVVPKPKKCSLAGQVFQDLALSRGSKNSLLHLGSSMRPPSCWHPSLPLTQSFNKHMPTMCQTLCCC